MNKQFFSIENATKLESIQNGSKIHVIGVCGVAMAQLAVSLSNKGYEVTGSDREFYEPMSSLLKSSQIKLFKGYEESNISDDCKYVVIGNAISSDNPEVIKTQIKNLPYTFFPKIIGDYLIQDKHSIVVCGTHGKTTTTALGATALNYLGKDPSYFIGGIAKDLKESFKVGNGKLSIVEGDEYDSAFFAKVPKFYFYKPTTAIITSVEYDHADIYPDLNSIEEVFNNLVLSLPSNGTVICCLDCQNVKRLSVKWKTQKSCITYGFDSLSDARIVNQDFKEGLQIITVHFQNQNFEIRTRLFGSHNARNVLAVYLSLFQAGLEHHDILKGIEHFSGVRRRQDIRFEQNDITIIEDFAHHPTAVHETLLAIKQGYPDKRILCAFEPRSNTSRRKVFADSYSEAFKDSKIVYIREVQARHNDNNIELMNIKEVALKIQQNGSQALVFNSTESLKEAVLKELKQGDVLVVMSNGSFDGLIDMLINDL